MIHARIVMVFLASTFALAFVSGLLRGWWSASDLGYQASAWAALMALPLLLGAVAAVSVAHIAIVVGRRRGLTLSARTRFALTAILLTLLPGALCSSYASVWPIPLVVSALLAGLSTTFPRASI